MALPIPITRVQVRFLPLVAAAALCVPLAARAQAGHVATIIDIQPIIRLTGPHLVSPTAARPSVA